MHTYISYLIILKSKILYLSREKTRKQGNLVKKCSKSYLENLVEWYFKYEIKKNILFLSTIISRSSCAILWIIFHFDYYVYTWQLTLALELETDTNTLSGQRLNVSLGS